MRSVQFVTNLFRFSYSVQSATECHYGAMGYLMSTVILFFLIFSSCSLQNGSGDGAKPKKHHNQIDDIKTSSEVESLLKSVNKDYEKFKVSETFENIGEKCRNSAKAIGARPWTKADFDNNGYTDLLVIGNYYGVEPIVIIDKGNNDFVAKEIKIDFSTECPLAVVVPGNPQPIVSYFDIDSYDYEELPKPKSLIYKFGGFVEVNQAPKSFGIENIEFETTGCYGTCPSFRLSIEKDRHALFHPIEYNKLKEGDYRALIVEENYKELTGLLNYIDFPSLKDEYSVGWTDLQRAFLTITYDGGKTKKIEDYGLMGSHGLNRVYEILFDLRENQDWKPVEPVSDSSE